MRKKILNIVIHAFAIFGFLGVVSLIFGQDDIGTACKEGDFVIDNKCFGCPDEYFVDIQKKQCVKKQDYYTYTDFDQVSKEVEELEYTKELLNSEIIRIRETPKEYPAGHFTVGEDIVVGRYKIYDGNSNFVVRDITNYPKVNIILSDDTRYGFVTEYIYEFEYGDKIQAESSFKIVGIE